MPRPRPPHLHHQTTRHGVTVWYVRMGKGPRIRIRGIYGSPEFLAEYQAAIDGKRAAVVPKSGAGSLKWLWDRYRETGLWQSLSFSTRRQRENIMAHVLASAGHEPFASITRKSLVAGRDRRAATPAMARNFVIVMRNLFKWALDAEHIEIDPTLGISAPKAPTDGFHAWSLDEMKTFMARWPLGTRERLAFDLILFTGLRRGDVVRVGRPHFRNGSIRVKTEKTGETVTVHAVAPLLASIAAADGAGITGDLTFLATQDGRPMVKEGFGNWFGATCKATGLPGTAHGLRKGLATLLTDFAGASEAELDSVFGWNGDGMALLYTKTRNRERLAGGLMMRLEERLANGLFPHPDEGEGLKAKKEMISNT